MCNQRSKNFLSKEMDLKTVFRQPELTIIDVREPFEFLVGHAKGAVNIPLRKIASNLEKIRALPQPIVVYCRSGNRSGQALNLLHANNITDVYNGGSLDEVRSHLRFRATKRTKV